MTSFIAAICLDKQYMAVIKGANVRHSHVVYLKFLRRHFEICDRVTVSFARILQSMNKRKRFCCHLSLHH